ncbi:MAG: helix-turn-helix transcriptional regulator [Deltaproteobacteria bacterium]|nr:helix-turn-helix transcriptional regulator [Deltaproteobacteria bacterium]
MRSFIALPTNRLDRFKVAEGLIGWDHDFPQETCDVPALPIGLEIGVLLRGKRTCEGARGSRTIEPGVVSVFALGEAYSTRYQPPADGRGREIGMVVRLDKHPAFAASGVVVRFPSATIIDLRLLELFAEVGRTLQSGEPLAGDEIEREVLTFLERHARFEAVDALERARLALHADFDKPLYMRHFAEIAGVHEATFTRRFATRYRLTPTRYRTRLRLSEASVLLGTHPELSVRDIARRVGFDDVPYFHRAFAATFGHTPLGLQRSFVAAHLSLDHVRGASSIHAGSR